MAADLRNSTAPIDVEHGQLINCYATYIRDVSSHRQTQYSHFISIHLILLPAHMAWITRDSSPSVIYSILVAVLGMTFCYLSYQRISSNFRHMEIAYQVLHELEADYPYRFFTVVGERLAASERRKHRFSIRPRRAELVFHWIIGGMYMALPVIHSNLVHLRGVFN